MRAQRIMTALLLIAIVAAIAWLMNVIRQGSELLAQVHPGMSHQQVRTLLGPPRDLGSDEIGERWDYASLRFPDVSVWFDTNGMVLHTASK